MSNTDELNITIKFNGKSVKLSEKGETAYPTFKNIMSLFTAKNETENNEPITSF